ncbi:MAG: transglutaminase family protein [bacterium]|nr:MAG: transglutaminase family protein [bacterium]
MGRKGSSGLSLLLITICVLAAGYGCEARSPAGDLAASFAPSGEETIRELGIYSGRERVGDLHSSRQEGTWKGGDAVVRFVEKVHLRLSFRGDRFSITSSQTSYVDRKMELVASRGVMDFGAGAWETVAVRSGDGVYQREQVAAGSRNIDRVSVPGDTLVSDALPMYLEKARLEKGAKVRLGVFNMALGQTFPLTLVFRGETESGRLYALTYWGMEERIWIDDNGMVVREEMALGVNARRPEEPEKTGHLPLESILSVTAVPGIGIPPDLGEREEALVVLEGSFRPPPQTRWQRVQSADDHALVTLLKPAVPPSNQRRPDKAQMPKDSFGLDLDSSRIREIALEIAGTIDDPWEKALAIGQWVYAELGKSMRECFTALQVLEAGEGECQSHSLLTVSLLRASGLPARFAYGVVYLPERKAFGFHTWVQVHVGEWIPMDPTLGNFPAGVDHLTLAVGGYQDQFRLFPFITGQGGWRIKFRES